MVDVSRPGSEWHELVVHASKTNPERWSGPPHGHPSRWDWGVTLRSLDLAWQRHAKLVEVVAEMTVEQRDALWSDPSEEAAALRRVAR